MKLQKQDYFAIAGFALAGFFNALMDYQAWEQYLGSGWMMSMFDWLGLKGWFLAEGGNERWRHFWFVWDFWHVCKNAMWISIGIGTAFATRGTLRWSWILLAWVTIGTSFVFWYHLVFGAPLS